MERELWCCVQLCYDHNVSPLPIGYKGFKQGALGQTGILQLFLDLDKRLVAIRRDVVHPTAKLHWQVRW